MLSYLSTDQKIRVMEKRMRSMDADSRKMHTYSYSKLMSRMAHYRKLLADSNAKLSLASAKVCKSMPPSRVDSAVAGVVAYSETVKKAKELLRQIELIRRKKHCKSPECKSQNILKYTE